MIKKLYDMAYFFKYCIFKFSYIDEWLYYKI